MTQLDIRHETDPLALLANLSEQAQGYVEASRAESTRATYASDWRTFSRWAKQAGLPHQIPVEPAVVAGWLAAQAPHRRHSTLARSLSAIKYMHAQQGLWSPTDHPQVRATLAGIKRQHPYAKKQALPLYLDDLTIALDALAESPKGFRNRAILLVGWWGAFRRSELVGLDFDDLTDDPLGMIINLRHSKTDQEGQGRLVPLHYHEESTCPVRALRAWTGIIEREGPVFRQVDQWGRVRSRALNGKTVGRVVKEAAVSLGLDPEEFSAHSLRAGFVSECDRRGIPSSAVRLVTGHKSEAMLATYTRPRNLFESSAGAYFGKASEGG